MNEVVSWKNHLTVNVNIGSFWKNP